VTRLLIVAAAAIGLILFAAFVVSRLLPSRTRGMSIRMQVFIALALIVGAFAFGLGILVVDRVEARASKLAKQAADDEATAIAGMIEGEMDRTGMSASAAPICAWSCSIPRAACSFRPAKRAPKGPRARSSWTRRFAFTRTTSAPCASSNPRS
jgi:hypothetical protein